MPDAFRERGNADLNHPDSVGWAACADAVDAAVEKIVDAGGGGVVVVGGAGSRLVIIIFSNLPIFPLSNCFFKLLCVGSYRLLKPNCIFGFNLLIFFLQVSIFLILKSSGFC